MSRAIAISRANEAIAMADEITAKVKKANGTTDTIVLIIVDILNNKDNIPFVTTVYEAVQEIKPQ